MQAAPDMQAAAMPSAMALTMDATSSDLFTPRLRDCSRDLCRLLLRQREIAAARVATHCPPTPRPDTFYIGDADEDDVEVLLLPHLHTEDAPAAMDLTATAEQDVQSVEPRDDADVSCSLSMAPGLRADRVGVDPRFVTPPRRHARLPESPRRTPDIAYQHQTVPPHGLTSATRPSP